MTTNLRGALTHLARLEVLCSSSSRGDLILQVRGSHGNGPKVGLHHSTSVPHATNNAGLVMLRSNTNAEQLLSNA